MAGYSMWTDATAKDLSAVYEVESPAKLVDWIDGLLLIVAGMSDTEALAVMDRAGLHYSHLAHYRAVADHRGLRPSSSAPPPR